MITWLQLAVLLPLPTVLLGLIAALPTREFNGHLLGGGPFREYLLNHIIVPVLPNDAAISLVQWFAHANVWQEWLLSLLIVVNINGVLLPLLYGLGEVLITVSTWIIRKDLELKRNAIRR